ncbi:uncharacterized protein LOC131016779 isoform X1 [Salvia miltiorrhiza]|uniref:uncharacterized protein LOC131016779 isoform X1 n=1 Tax=Salvia miltiorrhiza TaxID=226208 RepID=UPI0025ACA221|nr:uncharacterized protein LOC131016779 isoform X1 [Salvia miltiorrhiza]
MTSSKAQSPAYPSAARISDSDCFPAYTASLKCLEEYSNEKSKCQEHFDIYKECRKKEVRVLLYEKCFFIFSYVDC